MDLLKELSTFHFELKSHRDVLKNPDSIYVVDEGIDALRFLRKKSLEKSKEEAIENSREELIRKAGRYKNQIFEITGKKYYTQFGQAHEIWSDALQRGEYEHPISTALDFCIDAVNEAIGLLEAKEKSLGEQKEANLKEETSEAVEINESVITPGLKVDWKDIEKEFGITKRIFGNRISFVKDPFRRTIIFRDVEQAFILASSGFSKPALILAGGVIEELLRLYLEQKGISPQKPLKKDFNGYIQTCVQNRLLKDSVSHLSDSVRGFRNLVHLSAEETTRHTISKATAKGAVSSIFTIANDF